MYRVGIDLGGTNIAVGVIDEKFNIIGRGKQRTNAPRPAEEICDSIAEAVRLALCDAGITMDEVKFIGIGAPGSIDPISGIISWSNNLDFYMVPMVEYLEKRLNKPVKIDNDANAAALGEMVAGAGKGSKDFVTITLGTGVGSGIIVGGKMLLGCNFAGGELGHILLIKDGAQCTCGRKGCFEAYASATGLIRITKEKMLQHKDSVMWEIVDGDIDKVNGRTSFDAMRKGDKWGEETVDDYCGYLASGITNIVNIFQPEILCIGGGISNEKENILSRVKPVLEKERFSRNVKKQTELKIAQLGNDAGIIGAAMLDTMY